MAGGSKFGEVLISDPLLNGRQRKYVRCAKLLFSNSDLWLGRFSGDPSTLYICAEVL